MFCQKCLNRKSNYPTLSISTQSRIKIRLFHCVQPPEFMGWLRYSLSITTKKVKPMSQKNKKPVPFSLRLSHDERAQLDAEAGNIPLGAYIRMKLLKNPKPRRKQSRKKKPPVKDHITLSKLLATFGASRIGNNLNQIAKSMNSGSWIVSPKTEALLQDACKAVIEIRTILIRVLEL